jgi:hypothetical protein
MTYLELCQRLRQEARISGTGPTTTVSQSGEYKKVVDWIAAAYEDIQNQHEEWRFLQQPFSFTVTIGTRDYTPAEAGITDLRRWKHSSHGDIRCYLTAGDEQRLVYIPWNQFRDIYLIGTNRTTTGRPGVFSIEPDDTIAFDYLPDQEYTIVGEYYQQPDVMSGDTDEPIFPSNFHLAIVYRALMFFGVDYAADEKYAHGQNEYKKILRKLEQTQLPRLTWGAPLA